MRREPAIEDLKCRPFFGETPYDSTVFTEKSYMKKGFTLIELLVVISIIALLLSIIVPSLGKAKETASMINCLSNQKSFATALHMYVQSNRGNFCSGYVDQDVAVRNPPSWVMAPLAYGPSRNKIYMGNNPQLNLEHRLNGIREGALFPYLGSTDMYHCPGDRRLINGTSGMPTGADLSMYQVYRSYSLPDFYRARGSHDNGVANETKLANISGSKYLFVEDQYDAWTFNLGAWSYIPRSQTLWDPLGNYHKASATFAFVDGHAENYKWRDKRSMVFMSSRTEAVNNGYGRLEKFDPYNEDLDWLDQHYPSKTWWKGGNPPDTWGK